MPNVDVYTAWESNKKWFVFRIGDWNIIKLELEPALNIQLFENAVELKSLIGYFRTVKSEHKDIQIIVSSFSFLYEDYAKVTTKKAHHAGE